VAGLLGSKTKEEKKKGLLTFAQCDTIFDII
jgi:hypothetical protein